MEFLSGNLGIILLIINTLTMIVGVVVGLYKFSRDPDDKAANRLSLIEQMCEIRRESYDRRIKNIGKDLILIKENHLKHIESDIGDMKGDMKVIKEILNRK